MDLKFAILAEEAFREQDYKLHISGVFHEVAPPELPAVLGPKVPVMEWEAAPNEAGQDKRTEAHFFDPSGRLIVPHEVPPFSVPLEQAAFGLPVFPNAIVDLRDLPLVEPGFFPIRVFENGVLRASTGFYVFDPH